jgi:rSAM/selenodomain-associated transferase 2
VLSIIVPVLHDDAMLLQLLAQLHPLRPAAQIIVVDGAAPTVVSDTLKTLTDQYVFAATGRAKQMHAGTAYAQAPAFWFLHADSQLPNGAMAAVEHALSQAQWGRFNIALQGNSLWLPLVSRMMNWRSALTGICTGDQGLFVTAKAYKQVGGFAPIALMEDIALSRALKTVGAPQRINLPLTSSGRRWDSHGAIRTIFLMWFLRLRYWMGEDPEQLSKRYHS